MSNSFQLGRTDLILLIINLICLGGLIVLLCVKGPDPILILLLVGAAGMAMGKMGKGFGKSSHEKTNI